MFIDFLQPYKVNIWLKHSISLNDKLNLGNGCEVVFCAPACPMQLELKNLTLIQSNCLSNSLPPLRSWVRIPV